MMSQSQSKKQKSAASWKFISVYTEGEIRGVEMSVCNEMEPRLIAKRRRIFERDGENWAHQTAGNKELRMWVMGDSNSSADVKARSNFLNALRSISAENMKRGSQFFGKNMGKLTFSIEGWESKKPVNFVYETEGKLYRGEGKTRGILKQLNIGNKPYIMPHKVLFSDLDSRVKDIPTSSRYKQRLQWSSVPLRLHWRDSH